MDICVLLLSSRESIGVHSLRPSVSATTSRILVVARTHLISLYRDDRTCHIWLAGCGTKLCAQVSEDINFPDAYTGQHHRPQTAAGISIADNTDKASFHICSQTYPAETNS